MWQNPLYFIAVKIAQEYLKRIETQYNSIQMEYQQGFNESGINNCFFLLHIDYLIMIEHLIDNIVYSFWHLNHFVKLDKSLYLTKELIQHIKLTKSTYLNHKKLDKVFIALLLELSIKKEVEYVEF